jgi:hypothetical protein
MFKWFVKKLKGKSYNKTEFIWILPSEYDDITLYRILSASFKEMHVTGRSLFLVGMENWSIIYNTFTFVIDSDNNANRVSKYSHSFDGFVEVLSKSLLNYQLDSIEHEIVSRRVHYLYLATLMVEARKRAKNKPELWELMVDVWVPLIDGARELRAVLERTSLWSTKNEFGLDETSWFKDVNTPEEGENYVKNNMMPEQIRYHQKFEDEQLNYIERTQGIEAATEMAQIFKEINEINF